MEISIISGKQKGPKNVVLHGEAGVGKTTLASRLGKAIIIPTEDGSDHLDVDRLPLCRGYADVLESIKWVYDEKKAGNIDHDVVVLDSIDWAENFIEADLVREVFDQSYGKGNVEIGSRVGRLLRGLDMLNEMGMMVVVIAHSECRTVELAEGGSYSRWQPKLSKRSNARLQEWSDAVGFCTVEVLVSKESTGFSERGVGKSTGRRIVHFNPSASYVAKIRTDKKVSGGFDMSGIDKIKEVL